MKYGRGKNPNSRNGFKKGHGLNVGNQYARGLKHTNGWKKEASERMKGNTNGFKVGKLSPRKGKKSKKTAWNKGLKLPNFSGENHPNWIEDRTKIKRQNRKDNPRYKQWRKSVWERDGYRCRIMDKRCKGRIEAHHILRWVDYPELRYEPNNGITLCQHHHPKARKDEKKHEQIFFKIIDSPISHLSWANNVTK